MQYVYGIHAVDSLLQGWVVPSAARSTAHKYKGCVPLRKRAKLLLPAAEELASTRAEATRAEATRAGADDQASDLWCKGCMDDPEVVYCGFCGCRVRAHLLLAFLTSCVLAWTAAWLVTCEPVCEWFSDNSEQLNSYAL